MIPELEERAIQNPKTITIEELYTLAMHWWEAAKRAELRQKRKAFRTAAHYAVWAVKKGATSVDHLRACMELLGEAARHDSFPQDILAARGKAMAAWLQATGNGDHQIRSEMNGEVSLETATLAIADPEVAIDIHDPTDMMLTAETNAGRALYVSTCADGIYLARIRLIDAKEPVLKPREYRKNTGSSQVVVLSVRSGAIRFGDMAFLTEPSSAIELKLPVANYKCCVYGIGTEGTSLYLAVVCPTSEPATNSIDRIDEIQ